MDQFVYSILPNFFISFSISVRVARISCRKPRIRRRVVTTLRDAVGLPETVAKDFNNKNPPRENGNKFQTFIEMKKLVAQRSCREAMEC